MSWNRISDRLSLIFFLLKGGEPNMAVVSATLIIKGYKKFSQVPDPIKDEVREVLIALDCADLAQ